MDQQAPTNSAAAQPLRREAVLSARGLTKVYPGIIALDGVDLDLCAGQAHGLVGENGAGKSTLIKMLAGASKPDGGQILLSGDATRLLSPVVARRAGIAVVHQHSHLIPDLTLAENFALREGYPRNNLGLIAWKQLRHRAAEAVHVMLPGMDVERRASTLSGVEKQMVEISFALAGNPKVLVLDEPTAILPHAESDRLFRMVRGFLARDGAVLFVSHRLDEVFMLCDTVTVLRDGCRVWTKPVGETGHDDLIRAMVGRGVSFERDDTLRPGETTVLKIQDYSDKVGCFSSVDLDVRAGEIYGIYGLVGAGQAELCAALLGLRPATGSIELIGRQQYPASEKDHRANAARNDFHSTSDSDRITNSTSRPDGASKRTDAFSNPEEIDNLTDTAPDPKTDSAPDPEGIEPIIATSKERSDATRGFATHNSDPERVEHTINLTGKSAGARVRRGLALVPAERLERGMFRQMSVGENMSIASLGRKSVLGLVRTGRETTENQRFIKELQVKTTGPHKIAVQLSGGNQQKVLLARWLETQPRVLILEEPTQGVDVGAKMEIHRLVREQARAGVAVLLVSSEMPELLALSHRIGIMRQGRLVTEIKGAEASEEKILKVALPPQENVPVDDVDLEGAEKSSPPPVKKSASTGRNVRATERRELGLLVLLILIVVGASIFVPNFATAENFRDILKSQAVLILGAMGAGAVIIAGGIDISVGAILGLTALAAAKADTGGTFFGTTFGPQSTAVIWLAPLIIGAGLGALNGLLTVTGRVHSIVITLGMMFILQGAMLEIMDNKWIFNLSDKITSIGRGEFLPGVPNLILFAALGALVTAILLAKTVTGRRWYALGGDGASARLLGVNPRIVLPLAFAFSGLLVGLAGLLHAGFYGQLQTTAGRGYELKVIAAAVIGGVHIMGGRGTALGILTGALLLGVISNLLVFLHVSAFWDDAITGAVILVAVCADALNSRRERSLG